MIDREWEDWEQTDPQAWDAWSTSHTRFISINKSSDGWDWTVEGYETPEAIDYGEPFFVRRGKCATREDAKRQAKSMADRVFHPNDTLKLRIQHDPRTKPLFYFDVQSVLEARVAIRSIRAYDAFLFHMADQTPASKLQLFSAGEWVNLDLDSILTDNPELLLRRETEAA